MAETSKQREASAPAYVTTTDEQTVPWILRNRYETDPGSVMYEVKDGNGVFRPVSVRQFYGEVVAVAKGMVARGLQPGESVAIMGRNCYEWAVADFAAAFAGAVVVPIYPTATTEAAGWEIADSATRIAIAETVIQRDALTPLLDTVEGLEKVVCIADGALDELKAEGKDIDDAEIDRRSRLAKADDISSIIYTSGTTGKPKGSLLTHRNFVEHLLNGISHPDLQAFGAGNHTRTLLFLPLSHVFGRFVYLLCAHSASVVAFAPDTKALVADMQAFKPTWLLAVPRVLEIMYNTADAKAGAKPVTQRIFRWAAKQAADYSAATTGRGTASKTLSVRRDIADRLALHKLREATGGNLGHIICGGAPLSDKLSHFFRGIGIVVVEGYGQTETAAPTALNMPSLIKVGTVGGPYPGTAVKIAEDGEILIKGPHIFQGYLNRPEATADVFTDDGWLRTGDIGALDEDDYLTISGRKKEIIITAGGKNVQPAVLQDALQSHPLIGATVVVGDDRPFISALIGLDPAMLPKWLDNHGLDEKMSLADASQDPTVRAALQEAIDEANKQVSRAEQIREFRILPLELNEENGFLSAALKVKRQEVLKNFDDSIENIYASPK